MRAHPDVGARCVIDYFTGLLGSRCIELKLDFGQTNIDVLAADRLVAVNGDHVLAVLNERSFSSVVHRKHHVACGESFGFSRENAVDVDFAILIMPGAEVELFQVLGRQGSKGEVPTNPDVRGCPFGAYWSRLFGAEPGLAGGPAAVVEPG